MKVKANQQCFTDEFKEQTVRQVTGRGHKASRWPAGWASATRSLYAWLKRYAVSSEERVWQDEHRAQNRCLKAELKRVSEECDIWTKPPRTLPGTSDEGRLHQGT